MWHAAPAEEALARLNATTEGLNTKEAARRLAEFGPNSLPPPPKRHPLLRFAAQFNNVLIYILMLSAATSLLLGHSVDAAVIFAVVLVNAIVGFIQEGRAEQALEAIRSMIDPKASVMREGRRIVVPVADIVPGDLVLIEAGDRVPADLRLLRARNMRIDEAMLTGESVAVEKATEPVAEHAALGDRTSMAFSGTFVTTGQGVGIAVATGAQTELGHISSLLETVTSLKTPLIRRIDEFARQLTVIILAVAAVAFMFAWYVRGYSGDEAFMTVVGLAVAAIPEGLPAILTITLAIGVRRMAARNAIVRRLPAVETLGSVSVICSDKTGTLTRNEMTVRRIVTTRGALDVTGVGYEPKGAFEINGRSTDPADDPLVLPLVRAALLCNDAELRLVQAEGHSAWRVAGDPMEGALVAAAMKAGLDAEHARKELPRLDEIPFDAVHRFMATLHHNHEGESFALIKGAPETVAAMCARELTEHGPRSLDIEAWRERNEALASEGHRVLGFASKALAPGTTALSFESVANDAVFLGLAGFIDPPRAEALEAIADCKGAGIRVVMITGDHAATASEIARQLGIDERAKALTGNDLEALDAHSLRDVVREVSVFARTTPEHKLRLVEALQANRSIVAMTGDGVNDAPALKRADVGVAMGQKGTEVAKQAAEMVLADDNFASIVAAVREGRTVYDNILKVISWTLPTNGGEALTILCALALGLAMPITPAQILWVNMVTAVALGLVLAFEPTEPGAMRRPPRPTEHSILDLSLIWRITFVSILFVMGAFGIFYWGLERGASVEAARTLVVNALVVMEIAYLFSVRYVHGTSFTWRGVLGTPAVLIGILIVTAAQFVFTYMPFFQRVFQSEGVSFVEGLAVIGVGAALLVVAEIEKRVRHLIQARAD